MKILLVNYRYFVSGGPERYLFNLTTLLGAKGHEVVPFSIDYERNEPTPYARYFAPPLSEMSEVYFKDTSWSARSLRRSLERVFYSREVYERLAALIEHERPDCALVLHYLRKLSPSVLQCLHDHGVPFAVRLSDFGMVCPNAHLLRDGAPCELCVRGSLLNSVRHRCVQGSLAASAVNYAATRFHRRAGYFDLVTRFVVPSAFTLEKMVDGGWERERLTHVPTFVAAAAPGRAEQPSSPPTVVYVGRVEPIKGIHVLLDAVRLVRHRPGAPAFALRIVGDGDAGYVRTLTDYVDQHTLPDVHFDGPLPEEDVREALRCATCSVAPSLWYDNMPNAVLESLAEGTPVVAPDHGSFPEIVRPGSTGLLYAPGRPDSLADALLRLLTEPTTRANMGAEAARFVTEHHSPDRHYELLMETFARVRSASS